MKRIILCCDGTWENPKGDTNVYKLYRALTTTHDQVPYYDDGVGADGLELQKLLGGALGLGLLRKIKDGYMQIAHAYEPGDDIFLFGFSRGAFTARSIAGMIADVGLPTKCFDSLMLDEAFRAYRDRAFLAGVQEAYGMYDAKIKMVGVWDTVGSLGLPALEGQVDKLIYGFLDASLHPDVLNAYHALAIDERRREFPPTLWEEPCSVQPPAEGLGVTSNTTQQILKQVWFAGVHGDVGGGYDSPSPATQPGASCASSPSGRGEGLLSDIPLNWMMNQAASLGLVFDKFAMPPVTPQYALSPLHESWNVLWGFPKARAIDPAYAVLADTVAARLEHDATYKPRALAFDVSRYQIEKVI